MVKRCAWGTYKADNRYPENFNVSFHPFPKPKTKYDACLRWIRACGIPHSQLNVHNIDKHKYVCSLHFQNGTGPTKEFPDPIHADGSKAVRQRRPPKRRLPFEARKDSLDIQLGKHAHQPVPYMHECVPEETCEGLPEEPAPSEIGCQTESSWISPMDFLLLSMEYDSIKSKVQHQRQVIHHLQNEMTLKDQEIEKLKKRLADVKSKIFSAENVRNKEKKMKKLFVYYTGVTYVRFFALLSFLVPDGVNLPCGRRDVKKLFCEDSLLLTLCRLRHNFGLKDIAVRFGISLQSAGVVFNNWIKHMYFKLGQLSIWTHRDTVFKVMPGDFKKEFPRTVAIIDGTEIRTQKPCALGLQSQCYSDYKSSTTLKCLISCDPCGSINFVSTLFTGSVSDKQLCFDSGFFELLKSLKQTGYLCDGDAIMADKGFNISKELAEIGLCINVPPCIPNDKQMTQAETELTEKIARHRIHIERVIAKVKRYMIVSTRVPTSLFKNINQIWAICCHLTLFQDVFIKNKTTE